MANVFNKAAFEAAIAGDKPVLVDFWATWCGPCRILSPVVEQIAEEYADKIVVGKVDVDEEQELAGTYGIMSIPTLMLFKGGKKVDMSIGVVPADKIKSMIDAVL